MKLLFFIVNLDIAQRKRHPRWPWQRPGTWHHGMDLPPGRYWHQEHYPGYLRRDLPILPGERLELVVVLADDQPESYRGIPLCNLHERAHVLRRVRLTKDYTYEDLYQSSLYQQWKQEGAIEEYPSPLVSPQRSQQSPTEGR